MRKASLIVAVVVLLAGTSGCIVPEDMPALREELGYASVERPDLVVKARASTQTPTVDEPVELTAETEGLAIDAVDIRWTINGTTHDGATVETSFATAGMHPVEVEAEGPNGTTASDAITIEARPNQAPEADLRIEDDRLWAGEPVVVRADGSSDPDGDELSFDWRLDDEPVDAGSVLETEIAAGPHTVEVAVTDGYATRTVEQAFAVDQRLHHKANLSLTDDSTQFPAPIAASLDRAELTLTHATQSGLDQVNLTIQDADGNAIATVVTDPGPGDNQASAQLELDGASLEPGPHTLVLQLERGAESVATIEGVFTYSPLPPTPG